MLRRIRVLPARFYLPPNVIRLRARPPLRFATDDFLAVDDFDDAYLEEWMIGFPSVRTSA